MQKTNAAITAVGGYVPEYRLTNAVLEKMVDTNDEWIRTRTGISERRILKEEGKGSSDFSPLWSGQNAAGCQSLNAATITQQLLEGFQPCSS